MENKFLENIDKRETETQIAHTRTMVNIVEMFDKLSALKTNTYTVCKNEP